MYIPEHFAEPRLEVLQDLIEAQPLGILITNGASGLDANHIPFDLRRDEGEFGKLHCHVARKNPVWQELSDGDEVLVVFRRADAYISPQWYPSKHEAHRQVPTWNYLVAHAYGRVKIHDDERYIRVNVARLTRHHEANQPIPWKMSDAPRDFTDMMVKNVVGIEIEVTRIVGKIKLAQNKEVRDIRGAGEALASQGELVIGDAMIAVATEKERSS